MLYDDTNKVYYIKKSPKVPCIFWPQLLNDKKMNVMEDSGAEINLIKKSFVPVHFKRTDNITSIMGVGNGSLISESIEAIPLFEKIVYFRIVPDKVSFIGDAILGADFLESNFADICLKK